MTPDQPPTGVALMIGNVAAEHRIDPDRLIAAWPATHRAGDALARVLQLQRWAAGDHTTAGLTPAWRLAVAMLRAEDFSLRDPGRVVEFWQSHSWPAERTRDGELIRETYDGAGLRLAAGRVPLLLEHRSDQVLGEVVAVTIEGVDVRTVVQLDRGAQQDEILASVAFGEPVGLSWQTGTRRSQETRDGDRVHHRAATIYEASITATPARAHIRAARIVRPRHVPQLRARSIPRVNDTPVGAVVHPRFSDTAAGPHAGLPAGAVRGWADDRTKTQTRAVGHVLRTGWRP